MKREVKRGKASNHVNWTADHDDSTVTCFERMLHVIKHRRGRWLCLGDVKTGGSPGEGNV